MEEELAQSLSKLLEGLAKDGTAIEQFADSYKVLMKYYNQQLEIEIMKVSKKPAETIKDGTPFLLKFVKDDLHYLKLVGNNKRALYSVYDAKVDKLHGFATTEDGEKFTAHKELGALNLNSFN